MHRYIRSSICIFLAVSVLVYVSCTEACAVNRAAGTVLPRERKYNKTGGVILDQSCASGLAISGTYDPSRNGPYCKTTESLTARY